MYFGIECESLQKYKGIKLQKCLLACKKGINVVVVLNRMWISSKI